LEIKEKIKQCQNERDQLLDQLTMLQQDKDIAVVSRQGGELDFQKVSMKFEDMLIHR